EQREQERRDRERDRQERERERVERQDELYDDGQEALDEGEWDDAMRAFSRFAELKGPRADAALYWKAYAQNRIGQRPESLQTIAELVKAYPSSRYLQQAKALEVEVRRDAGQPVRPESQSDEELKLMAIQGLQHSDPERAIPLLEGILQGTASPKLKGRALFVLAQSNSPRARTVLAGVAKGNSLPDLQERAIQYLGIHGGHENRALLSEIYAASNDVGIKRRVLRAFMVAGEKDRVMAAATSEQVPELRAEAVQQLGVMGAHAELAQLYQKETSIEVKKRILRAMFVGGDATRLIDLARTETNVELRRLAVRNLGLIGSQRTGGALIDIYSKDTDADIKRAVIQALFIQNNGESLVALARKESDPAMKREMVQKLSLMSGNKAAQEYML
ncbi:MAG: HEAT repeat domain-containing protein, partial [Steroidobacteraceae bacterium]